MRPFDFIRQFALRRLLRQNPGFFDTDHYVRNNLYVLQLKLTPLEHYIRYGSRDNKTPNGVFDFDYYRSQVPGLKPDKDCASHYLRHGWRRGYKPHALFDPAFYCQQHPEIAASGEDPLSHYLRAGWKQGYDPHLFFDVAHYLFAYPDLAEAGLEPLQHYIASGAKETRRPNAIFKPDYYILSAAGKGLTLEQALPHFCEHASAEMRALFSHPRFRLKGPVGRIDDYALATGQRLVTIPDDTNRVWMSPAIINRDRPRTEIHATLPQPYVAVLKNVIAFPGTRLLVTQDHQILHDELADDRAPDYFDKLKAIGTCKKGLCIISATYIGLKLDRALLLSSDTDFNFFHLLVEALPKMRLAEFADCPADIPILMQGDIHPNLVEAIERVAGGRQIIYAPWGSAIEVGELWYASDLSRLLNTATQSIDVSYDIVFSPAAIRDVSQRLNPHRPQAPGSRKIYMSRNSHYRQLSNQDAFMDMLKQKGFEIIDTGQMTLQQQIDAMAGVALIIAPTGAALTNLLWCQPGTKVLILVVDHPQMNLNIFNHVGESMGAIVEYCLGDRLNQMTGDNAVHDNFEADLNVISDWCDRNDTRLSRAG